MKNVFILFTFIFLTSFAYKVENNKLQNGHYLVKLDDKYKNQGLNDFDFTLENEKFTMKIANEYKELEIIWVDEKTFIVKGYTESANPIKLEKSFSKKDKLYFQISKIDDKEYYFTLGLLNDQYPIYAGKFIKT